jgi:arylformamidase
LGAKVTGSWVGYVDAIPENGVRGGTRLQGTVIVIQMGGVENVAMIYDVSVPITSTMPVWPSDPSVNLTPAAYVMEDQNRTVRVTKIEMGSHTGTHIDAPWHMLDDGRRMNEIPIETLVGPASVFEIPHAASITRGSLEKLKFEGVQRVLFKTENSQHWHDGKFYEQFVYLEPEAAELLVERGVKLVGIDYLSIDKFDSETHPSHFVLLGQNVVIVEGLNLSRVEPGQYHMTALPLNLQDVDGAPTRVILSRDD